MASASEAIDYLNEHKYEEARVTSGDERIAYRKSSGDGSWENYTADEMGWVREEMGSCCIEHAKKNPKANFCPHCGTGINKTVTYRRGSSDLESIATDNHNQKNNYLF